jgi:hypothetical protein
MVSRSVLYICLNEPLKAVTCYLMHNILISSSTSCTVLAIPSAMAAIRETRVSAKALARFGDKGYRRTSIRAGRAMQVRERGSVLVYMIILLNSPVQRRCLYRGNILFVSFYVFRLSFVHSLQFPVIIMVAYASYAARTATLFSVYSVATASLQAYTADTNPLEFCGIATVTVYEYAPPLPTTNAHDHGGPYFNPYNDVPLPYQWPGKPSAGHSQASPHPTTPYQYGGPAKHAYDAPAWIPKGQNRLKSSFPKGKQNGASSWGELDCPRLPISGLPRGSSHPSHVVSSSHTKSTAHLLPPYPYHSSFSAPASSLADALETTPPTTHSSLSIETSVSISLSDDSAKTALPTLFSGNATHTTFPTSVSGSSAETAFSTSIFGNSTVTAAPTSLSSNSTGTAFLTSFSGNSTQTAFLTAISGNSTKVAFPTAISGNATNVAFPTSTSSNVTKTAFLDSVSSNATRTAFPTSFSGNASRTAFPTSFSGNASRTAFPTSYSGNATSMAFPTSYSSSATPVPACPTMPDTGVTRTYDMHLAYQTVAPDGVTRNGLTINGQFPGPMVEANWYVKVPCM